MKTVEQMMQEKGIDYRASVSDTKVLRACNKLMRSRDDSHLWPIRGRFNATDRAIRYFSRVVFPANGPCSALEYCLGIDGHISQIVNNSDNF